MSNILRKLYKTITKNVIWQKRKRMETPKPTFRNLHLANVLNSNTKIEVPASPVLKSLGYGSGVDVYYLERSPSLTGEVRSPWAIKRVSKKFRLFNKECSNIFNGRIIKEAEILRQLKHPNIVGFRAITQEKNGMDTLALECCSTSLGLLLENRLEQNLGALPANHIKKMICDISNALNYLHTEAKILHGDLKSHNVLVNDNFDVCKLCDFGVSLPLNAEGILNFMENPGISYIGTTAWCAPEIIDGQDVIDSKAEIFSFGLTIYETIALVPPHTANMGVSDGDISDDESSSDVSLNEGNLSIELAFGTRPSLPQAFVLTDDYNIILELFYLCTNSCPDYRPSAKAIYDTLTKEA